MAQKTNIETTLPPLDDLDYEFLFTQLLEGIFHGWHQGRVAKFFQLLGDRGRAELWVEWLKRYDEKITTANNFNQQMAVQMLRLGDLIRDTPKISKIGIAAREIAEKWLNLNAGSSVWEYEGPDAPAPNNSIETEQTITIEQLFVMLQQDSNLVGQMAQQLGLNTEDPQAIVDFLLAQSPQSTATETATTTTETEAEPENAEDWFTLGLKQAELGNMQGAIACWDKALELDPNISSAWHNRGSALGYLGRFYEAIASFDQAIAINPEDFQAWNDRGLALFNQQNWDEALASWDKVIEIEPKCFQAWYNRGCLLESTGRKAEAIESLQKVVEIQPDFEAAQTRLSNLQNSISSVDGQN
jgi:tetratricopeptide (TPR) repeat protein